LLFLGLGLGVTCAAFGWLKSASNLCPALCICRSIDTWGVPVTESDPVPSPFVYIYATELSPDSTKITA
jgi:hypothetical protein